MKLTQSQVFGIIQSVLSALGGFLVAKGITDNVTVTTGIGVISGLVGMIWAFVDKTADVTTVEETLRQAGSFVGGIFIAKGKLSADELNTWLGLISTLVPVILSFIAKTPAAPGTTTVTTPTSTTTTTTISK